MTQTAPTVLSEAEASVAALERLQRQVELQERWRRDVEEITELAIRFHSLDSAPSAGKVSPDVSDIASRLASARRSLSEVEDAMRALDTDPALIGDRA